MTLAHLEPRTDLVQVSSSVERVTLESQLALWRDVAEFASHIAATEFVPKELRNKPAAVAAAMLRANELGISPMQGLAQIHVINGRPGLAAELMRALIAAAGHEMWTEEFTQTRVTLCGRRHGSDHVEKVTWTMDDAKRAGLGGDTYRKYPRAMLLARATGELARLNFADVLAGMSYTVEELQDWVDVDEIDEPGAGDEKPKGQTRKAARPTAKARGRTSTAGPRTAITAGSPPPLPGEDDDVAPPVDTTARDDEPEELVTKRAQQIAIRANDADVDHHHVVAAVTNGQKTSAKAVTAAEASQVLDALNAIKMGEARLVEADDVYTIEAVDRSDVQEHEWSSEQWRAFLKEHGVTIGSLIKEAARFCAEHGGEAPTKLDDLRENEALCVWLHSWVSEQ